MTKRDPLTLFQLICSSKNSSADVFASFKDKLIDKKKKEIKGLPT
jgi:hypothetical protein